MKTTEGAWRAKTLGALRVGTTKRLRTQVETARHLLDSLEGQLEAGLDVAETAESLSTSTDRILESAAALRAIDALG